jgi:hypothetical protein
MQSQSTGPFPKFAATFLVCFVVAFFVCRAPWSQSKSRSMATDTSGEKKADASATGRGESGGSDFSPIAPADTPAQVDVSAEKKASPPPAAAAATESAPPATQSETKEGKEKDTAKVHWCGCIIGRITVLLSILIVDFAIRIGSQSLACTSCRNRFLLVMVPRRTPRTKPLMRSRGSNSAKTLRMATALPSDSPSIATSVATSLSLHCANSTLKTSPLLD